MDIASVTSYPINHFKELEIRGKLNLQPAVQRNLVWSDNQSIYLIDTLMKNLPLALLFAETIIDANQDTIWNIIDGQQRLTSIIRFLKGDLTLNTLTHPNSENLDPDLHGKTFSTLSTAQQNHLLKYKLSVVELSNTTEEEIRDMFIRLNINNVSLNKQELRNATYTGDFISLCRELAETHEDFFTEQKIFSANHFKRMRDVEFVSELVASMKYGVIDKKTNLDDYYKTNESMQPSEVSQLRKDFNSIMKEIQQIFQQDELKTTIFKKFTSFYSIFYSIYDLKKTKYVIDNNDYSDLANELIQVSINTHKDTTIDSLRTYFDSVVQGGDTKSNRTYRNNFLKELIIPFTNKRDEQRVFSETQRQILWHKNKDKKCGFCGEIINSYGEMDADHYPVKYSDGGPTEITNGRIAHRSCNRAN